MRYVMWVFLPLVFLFFISLAVKNTDLVSVRYFLGHEYRVPLIAVILFFLLLGVALGVAGMLVNYVRQRREILRLKQELHAHRPVSRDPSPPDVVAP
jgi:putative membrane protein